jgi:hypothetical protein
MWSGHRLQASPSRRPPSLRSFQLVQQTDGLGAAVGRINGSLWSGERRANSEVVLGRAVTVTGILLPRRQGGRASTTVGGPARECGSTNGPVALRVGCHCRAGRAVGVAGLHLRPGCRRKCGAGGRAAGGKSTIEGECDPGVRPRRAAWKFRPDPYRHHPFPFSHLPVLPSRSFSCSPLAHPLVSISLIVFLLPSRSLPCPLSRIDSLGVQPGVDNRIGPATAQ